MVAIHTNTIFPTLDVRGLLAVAWEWLSTVALTFWIGILVIESMLDNGEEQPSVLLIRSSKEAQPWQWLCLSILLVSEIIALILRAAQFTQSLNGKTLDPAVLGQLLFHSTYGTLWLARTIFILGSLGLLWWTTNGLSSSLRASTIAGLILAGLILLTGTLSGDVAQPDTHHPLYAPVLDWLSLAAQSIWFGGFAYLGYVFLPLLSTLEPDRSRGILPLLLQRFRPLILSAICVLFVSELYVTRSSVSNVQQFVTNPYGYALLVQWAIILLMILLSTYALFVLRPKLMRQAAVVPGADAELSTQQIRQSALDQLVSSFRQLLRVQSWLGAAVLLCAGLMTFFTPPIAFPQTQYSQNATTRTPSSTSITQTKQVGNLSVTLTVVPGNVDASHTVTAKVTDTRSGQPVSNAHIEVSTNMEVMDMGTAQAIMRGGTPTYTATFPQDAAFSMPGIWDIGLKISLPKHSPVVVIFAVTLSDS